MRTTRLLMKVVWKQYSAVIRWIILTISFIALALPHVEFSHNYPIINSILSQNTVVITWRIITTPLLTQKLVHGLREKYYKAERSENGRGRTLFKQKVLSVQRFWLSLYSIQPCADFADIRKKGSKVLHSFTTGTWELLQNTLLMAEEIGPDDAQVVVMEPSKIYLTMAARFLLARRKVSITRKMMGATGIVVLPAVHTELLCNWCLTAH